MSSENRPKDFFAKQIRSSHLIASGGIINPSSSDWDEDFANLRLMIYPKDALEIPSPFPGVAPTYIDGAFEGIVPPRLLNDQDTGLKVGDDVWLFISGSQNTMGKDNDGDGVIDADEREKRADSGVVLFGGDVVVSGTLYAEKQVVEVDLYKEGQLFVSGNVHAQDYIPSINFVQFRAPYRDENGNLAYLDTIAKDGLSFKDPAGVEPNIDVSNITDAAGVGKYNFNIYFDYIRPGFANSQAQRNTFVEAIQMTGKPLRYGPFYASANEVILEHIDDVFTLTHLNRLIKDWRELALRYSRFEILVYCLADAYWDNIFEIFSRIKAGGDDLGDPAVEGTISHSIQFVEDTYASVQPAAEITYEQYNLRGGTSQDLYSEVASRNEDATTKVIDMTTHIKLIADALGILGGGGDTPGGVLATDITSLANIRSQIDIFAGNAAQVNAIYRDAPHDPELFTSIEQVISANLAYNAGLFNPSPADGEVLFNISSEEKSSLGRGNGTVSINISPFNTYASLDVGPGYGINRDPIEHTDHVIKDSTGADVPVQLYIEGQAQQPVAGTSIFWHAVDTQEPLAWSHDKAVLAPDVLRLVGLKEDITNYETNNIEPKVLTITDKGIVRFKQGGLGGAKLKEDRDGREDAGDLDTNESTEDANGGLIWGDDYDPANPDEAVAGNPYDNGYFVDRWHGDTLVGHALDDVNQALKTIDENNAWLWPNEDAIEGGDKVTLRDSTNLVGIGTSDPVQKLHVHSGEGLNTAVRIESGETDDNGNTVNPDAHAKMEFAIDDRVHSTISQHVRPGLNSSNGTDTVIQNHSISGGHYMSTYHLKNGNEYSLAPFVIDTNRQAEGDELQVLILSGTTGQDSNGLNPRNFQDTNFFVSGSIGSCVDPLDQDGDSLQPGNGERGTAVFGGDVYVSGTIFGPNGVMGSGGGWMTALNGVCMDVFTESAYGEEGTTPASAMQPINTQFIEHGTGVIPENEDDDFSQTYLRFYSTENGLAGNGVSVVMTLSPSTSSLDEDLSISWDAGTSQLNIVVPRLWDPELNDDGLDAANDNDNTWVSIATIVELVNGEGQYRDNGRFGEATWPVRAMIYKTWQSNNIGTTRLTNAWQIATIEDDHNGQAITWNLNGGGDSYRYVSWGADATSGYSPSEGMAENTGDTFTRQDWAQGLVMPFNSTIVGYSVRYMSKDPFKITAPGVNATGNEKVVWEIGTLNAGTDPDPGNSYSGDATTAVSFVQLADSETGAIPQWVQWTFQDEISNGGTGYPIKWIGEGDDGSGDHSQTISLQIAAGTTIAVRAVEKDCDVYSDYRAEASVTLWLAGGGSINLGGGGVQGGNQNQNQNQGGGLTENDIRTYSIVDTSVGVPQVNPYGENEFKTVLSSNSLINYISLTHVPGDKAYVELPDATTHAGHSFVIKDSFGNSSANDTRIRIAPIQGQSIDQYSSWGPDDGSGTLTFNTDPNGNNLEPLAIEQSFASISIWSDGSRWLIS